MKSDSCVGISNKINWLKIREFGCKTECNELVGEVMAIPDYQSIMLPLLRLVANEGPVRTKDAVGKISTLFNLTENEKAELLPSGNQRIIDNRVGWSRTYLKKAGLLLYPQRGVLEITDRGKQVLQNPPDAINARFLRQFPEFVEFQSASGSSGESEIKELTGSVQVHTPEELLESSFQSLKRQLLDDILEKIMNCSPNFFETLVVDVLVTMGYGGSRKDAGKAFCKSGDEGIDGIINEDRLGLDVIYIQAKRWQGVIGRPEIQKFAGALQGKRAKKGVFITTSDFTSDAKEFVRNIDAKIVLMSGRELCNLIWEHNIGVSTAVIYEVKRLDSDYFVD